MSLHEYDISKVIAGNDPPFYSLIMAAIRRADTVNTEKLKIMWPEVYEEFKNRYHMPGGLLEGEE